jgi:ADP-ribose pyrophosphatase
MYLARDLTFRAPDPDEDEFLEAEFVPLEELAEQCLSGRIQDAKTVAAVLKARAMGL